MRERVRAAGRRLQATPPTVLAVVIVLTAVVGTARAAAPVLHRAGSTTHGATSAADAHGVSAAVTQRDAGAADPSALPSGLVAAPAQRGPGATARPSAAPTVAPLHGLTEADAYVTLPRELTPAEVGHLLGLPGVKALEAVDTGQVTVAGHPANAIGVDPSTFRSWTPQLSAESDPLWRSVARGELTVSFDMGKDARLPLGQDVVVGAYHKLRPVRIGAFASMGVSAVDAVVDRATARAWHFAPGQGLLVSAPKADPTKVRDELKAALPAGSDIQLLRQVVVVRDAGEFLTRAQIQTVIKAAAGRIGKPYVWGAIGPNAFDCSGLVGYAFAQAGIFLPRTSQQQWYAGPHVSLADARPGDLLFWAYDPTDPGNIDHVALYVGDGKMIVAPHTGDVVRLRDVPTAHLAGVVRVDPATASRVGGTRFLDVGGLLAVG